MRQGDNRKTCEGKARHRIDYATGHRMPTLRGRKAKCPTGGERQGLRGGYEDEGYDGRGAKDYGATKGYAGPA